MVRTTRSAILLTLLFCVGRAHADAGIDWLSAQQTSSGTYSRVTDVSTAYQSTSETLRTFAAFGLPGSAAQTNARQVLAAETYHNAENLSRQIISGLNGGQNVSVLVTELKTLQDPITGGFSERPGWSVSAFDTSLALEALALSGDLTSATASSGVGFLLQRQNADGGWSDGSNVSTPYLTALALTALNNYSSSFSISSQLSSASNFLLSGRGSDGLWGLDHISAQSLVALLRSLTDLTPVQASIQALRSHQLTDGSFGDDVFTTALALRALSIAQARNSGTATGRGAVQGVVTLAGSTQPLAGVTVSVPSVNGLSVQTNTNGYFLISSLTLGNVTVVASKAGYSSASAVANVAVGQTATVAGLALSPSSQLAVLRVHLFDATSGAAISGATVSLNGPAMYQGTTDAGGNVELAGIQPGSYSFSIQKTGYPALQGSLSAVGGQTLALNQALSQTGSSGPAMVSGTIVDGGSKAPLSGATFDLGNGQKATSDSSGNFSIASVASGSYSPIASATGYQSQSYTLAISGSGTGKLGTLSLYPAQATAAPNTVTLLGTVLDGLSNKAVSGATATISATSATTDANGQFTASNIQTLSFQVQVSAAGYVSQTFGVTSSAYGAIAATFLLPPQSSGGTTTSLSGVITNSSTGAAISGAKMTVSGTSISATSDSAGNYQLTNLPSQFQLQATAVNYVDKTLSVSFSGPGTYSLNLGLDPTNQPSNFQIQSLATNDAGKGANQVQLFTAQVSNTATSIQQALVVGHVLDSSGKNVGSVSPYAPGTQNLQSSFSFQAQETKTLTIPWNPAQLPPGAYTLELTVVQPGTITQSVPTGTVLAQRSAFTNVSATQALMGTLAFNPPLTQVGSTAPVSLQVLTVNSGNVPLSGTALAMTIVKPDGTAAFTATATPPGLPVGQFAYVSFGTWVPSVTGNLSVTVAPQVAAVQGQITGTLYVGDRPQGAFAVTPTSVFTGNQTVHATVNVTGVDKAIGVSDPIVFAIKNAVLKGSQYVAPAARYDQDTAHCLRCHVQSQSYFGLASLSGRNFASDQSATQLLYNALNTGQLDDGSIHNSHPTYAETETALGLWALTQAPDKLATFRTEYRAAKFQQSRATTSGSSTYWYPDYGYGWWANVDSHTMMAVKGFADLLTTAQNNNLSGISDFKASSSIANLGGDLDGMKLGPDGALYAVTWTAGKLLRFDPTTSAVSVVATGLPQQCSDVLPISVSEFFVSCAGALIHVLPDGTKQTAVALGSGGGIAQGTDGSIYVSDGSYNRILRGSVGGAFTTYVSGGLLNYPLGLAVAPDGSLEVANYSSFNILKVSPAGAVSVYVDGLAFPPIFVVPQADGSSYVGHNSYCNSDLCTNEGLIRISSQGAAQRYFDLPGLRGVAIAGGQLYMASYPSGNLYTLITQQLDTSLLPTLAAQMTGATHYFLNEYNDGTPYNIYQAVRLIGLMEARKVTTDSALLSQIDQATAAINSLLRARQLADGGWGFTPGYGSDAMVTALAGMALDYLSPRSDDPAVLKAVQYLINTQQADGSWYSANGIMGTRLASTSLVMAYLPRVLDRLGGLSVDLHLNFPSTATLSNLSQPPSGNVATAGGGAAYTWKLPGVTSQGKTVTFDLTLANMQVNETRPAASQAYLLSQNSFNSDQVRVDLTIPQIHASNGLSLVSLQTDKSVYNANDTSLISASVMNVAPSAVSGNVVFTIRSAVDQSVVTQLAPIAVSNLASGQTMPVNAQWPVGNTRAGNYQVVADLFDSASGAQVDEKVANFAVAATAASGQPPGTTVTLRTTTGQQTYNTTDRITIDDLVRNQTSNASYAGTVLQVQVYSPSGALLFSQQISLGQLAAGATVDRTLTYAANGIAEGTYTVKATVLDGSGNTLATQSTSFNVVENRAISIVGTTTVASTSLQQGDTQVCTDMVKNRGTLAATNLPIREMLVRLDQTATINSADSTVTLAAGASQTLTRGFSTTPLAAPADYACVLQDYVNGGWLTLSYASFHLAPPPIRVDTSVGLGSKGRLLILMEPDPPTSSTNGSTNGEPPYSQQRPFLEALLKAQGWSYTIVLDKDSFARELRKGDYSVYALFAETIKLDDQVQEELREAVYRGEALLSADQHDMREAKLEDAIGDKYIGVHSSTSGVEFFASDFTQATFANLALPGKALRAQLAGATEVAHFQGTGVADDAAVTSYRYGNGTTVYAGFDLLAEATLTGSNSTYANVLIQALAYLQPAYSTLYTGETVPVSITLTNRGIAVPGQVLLTLPGGTTISDNGGGSTDSTGRLVWNYNLSVNGAQTFTAWLRMPSSPGSITFNVQNQASGPSGYIAQTPTSLTVNLQAKPGLQDARTLAASDSAFKVVQVWLEKAAADLQNNLYAQALSDLVNATDAAMKTSTSNTKTLRLEIDQAILDTSRHL